MTEESAVVYGDMLGKGAQEATNDATRLYEAGYFEVLGLLSWIDENQSKSLVEDETSKLEALGVMAQMTLRFTRHLTQLRTEPKVPFAFHLIFGILNAVYTWPLLTGKMHQRRSAAPSPEIEQRNRRRNTQRGSRKTDPGL